MHLVFLLVAVVVLISSFDFIFSYFYGCWDWIFVFVFLYLCAWLSVRLSKSLFKGFRPKSRPLLRFFSFLNFFGAQPFLVVLALPVAGLSIIFFVSLIVNGHAFGAAIFGLLGMGCAGVLAAIGESLSKGS